MLKKLIFTFVLLLFYFIQPKVSAQNTTEVVNASHGKYLSPKGTIRILLIFAEFEYKEGEDPVQEAHEEWKKGELPKWKDQLFDAYDSIPNSQGKITQYFREMSFGNYVVLGDYLLNPAAPTKPFLIPRTNPNIPLIVSKQDSFLTNNNLKKEDFDLWTDWRFPNSLEGVAKITPNIAGERKYDHVMVIVRNHFDSYYKVGRGTAHPSSGGIFMGWHSDTYSQFGANILPFGLCLHEYSHLIFGDNNFHAGGGRHLNDYQNTYYLSSVQSGWSSMGGANSALQTCNAWDRDRLNWKPNFKELSISALNPTTLKEVSTDLNSLDSTHAGRYLVRDFVTTGDAIRIKLAVGKGEYPQWLWIENHQTKSRNKSKFDQYKFENEYDCIQKAQAGMYAFIQTDKHIKSGSGTFGGNADYLRMIPATGFYDLEFDGGEQRYNACVQANTTYPYQRKKELSNPFSGFSEWEYFPTNMDTDSLNIGAKEYKVPFSERLSQDSVIDELSFNGKSAQVFTHRTQSKLGISTNPSSSNMLTLVNKSNATGSSLDNRTIYVSGLSVRIVEAKKEGDLLIEVKLEDRVIEENTRWCAPRIVLLPTKSPSKPALIIPKGKKLIVDQGLSPTRRVQPNVYQGKLVFTDSTTVLCTDCGTIRIENGGQLIVKNGSRLILKGNAKIEVEKGGKLLTQTGGKVVYE